MSADISPLFAVIAKEGPAWAMATLMLIGILLLAWKVFPEIRRWRADSHEEAMTREARKDEERKERARMEGQWLQALNQSTEALNTSSRINERILRKLDEDEEQTARIDEKLETVLINQNLLLERTR